MGRNLPVELVTQYDHVLELVGNRVLLGISAVPDLCFLKKAESRALDHLGRASKRIRPEEDGCAKNPFESGHQSAVLLSPFVHSEGLQHLRSGAEANGLTLLAHGEGGQINWHDTVLAKGQPVVRM